MLIENGDGSEALVDTITSILSRGCDSLLDAGARAGRRTHHLRHIPRLLSVDVMLHTNEPPVPFLLADLRTIDTILAPKSFDFTICLDVIEHITPGEGWRLIKVLEGLTRQTVLFFTPMGELWLEHMQGPDGHHSGWMPEDFQFAGYEVWAWPNFHRFPDGGVHGAFFAWKTLDGRQLPAEALRDEVWRCLGTPHDRDRGDETSSTDEAPARDTRPVRAGNGSERTASSAAR